MVPSGLAGPGSITATSHTRHHTFTARMLWPIQPAPHTSGTPATLPNARTLALLERRGRPEGCFSGGRLRNHRQQGNAAFDRDHRLSRPSGTYRIRPRPPLPRTTPLKAPINDVHQECVTCAIDTLCPQHPPGPSSFGIVLDTSTPSTLGGKAVARCLASNAGTGWALGSGLNLSHAANRITPCGGATRRPFDHSCRPR